MPAPRNRNLLMVFCYQCSVCEIGKLLWLSRIIYEYHYLSHVSAATLVPLENSTGNFPIRYINYIVIQNTIFWDITSCSPLSVNRRFGGTYRLHLQGRRNNLSKKPARKHLAPLMTTSVRTSNPTGIYCCYSEMKSSVKRRSG
jgi:hypothetical protein